MMSGIALVFELDAFTSSILVLLSIPMMLFALLRRDPVYSLRDCNKDSDILCA